MIHPRSIRRLSAWLLAVGLWASDASAQESGIGRGDVNCDGTLDVADVSYWYPTRTCWTNGDDCAHEVGDVDGDGFQFTMTDRVILFNSLFLDPDFEISAEACPDHEPGPGPRAADVALGLELASPPSTAPDGGVSLEVFVTLTTTNTTLDLGPNAWSFGVAADGARVVAIEETELATDPEALARSWGWNRLIDPMPDDAGGETGSAAVSGRILGVSIRWEVPFPWTSLPREGTERIARLVLATDSPPGETDSVRLRFVGGLRPVFLNGEGRPIPNVVAIDGVSHAPELRDAEFSLAVSTQLPGDCNADGLVDLSDAVCLLGFLFLGDRPALPCGDGTATDDGNLALLDFNGDGAIDASDVIGQLSRLFLGGPAHVNGEACTSIPECAGVESGCT